MYTLYYKRGESMRPVANFEAETDSEASKLASKAYQEFCNERNFHIYYTRMWNANGCTYFDVGSHTEFFVLSPAISMTEVFTDGAET